MKSGHKMISFIFYEQFVQMTRLRATFDTLQIAFGSPDLAPPSVHTIGFYSLRIRTVRVGTRTPRHLHASNSTIFRMAQNRYQWNRQNAHSLEPIGFQWNERCPDTKTRSKCQRVTEKWKVANYDKSTRKALQNMQRMFVTFCCPMVRSLEISKIANTQIKFIATERFLFLNLESMHAPRRSIDTI